jgi:hypothetical protein
MFTTGKPRPWKIRSIFGNPNINMDFVNDVASLEFKFPKKKKAKRKVRCHIKQPDWQLVSSNPGITMQDIENNIEKPWDWLCVSRNPNLTMEFVLKYIDKPWNWFIISSHSNITMQNIETNFDNPKVQWVAAYIARNPNVTQEFMDKMFNGMPLSNIIIDHPLTLISKEEIEEHLERISCKDGNSFKFSAEIDLHYISMNKNIDMDLIKKYIYIRWNWGCISANSAITMNNIIENQHLPWDCRFLSSNPNLTSQFVLEHPNYNWNIYSICCNKFNIETKLLHSVNFEQ